MECSMSCFAGRAATASVLGAFLCCCSAHSEGVLWSSCDLSPPLCQYITTVTARYISGVCDYLCPQKTMTSGVITIVATLFIFPSHLIVCVSVCV